MERTVTMPIRSFYLISIPRLLLVFLLGNFCVNPTVFAQFSPSDLLQYVDDKGVERSTILIESDWNGMRVDAFGIKLDMSVERATRHLSAIFAQSQAIHMQHDELPISIVHWSHLDTSVFILLGQVDKDKTVGLLSTLHRNPDKFSEMKSSIKKPDQKMFLSSKSFMRELEQLGHKPLFIFLDQQYLAGFVDAGSIQTTSKKYRQFLKSNAWLTLFSTSDCQADPNQKHVIPFKDQSRQSCRQVMTKDGIALELNHLFTGNRTLTLIHAKSSG